MQGTYIVPIPLSANLTNITLNGALDGQQVVLEFQQNGTGGWTVASSTIIGLQQPVATASTNSFQLFIYNSGLSEWQAFGGSGVSGVTSLNGLTGAFSITGTGTNTVSIVGGNIQVAGSGGGGGVTSLNSLTGGLNVTALSGIAVSTSGSNIQIANTSSALSVPWFDIQNYGGQPRLFSVSLETTTATALSGNPDLTLASALHFQNGQWVVLWQAGNSTTQSTPSAPAATAECVVGSQSLTYQCVGADSLGGLTAASSAITITNAPNVFGNLAVAISSITAAAGTVTATFSSPINANVGNTIHIIHVTGSGATWNGVWTVVTAPTTSSVTYSVSGATGTGTISAASTGRLSNVQPITAISRSALGVITITTAQPHNYVETHSTKNPAVVIVENCSPPDLNGQYVMGTGTTGSTIVCNTGQWIATTGSVTAGSSTATSYEYVYVKCPAYSGTTVAYYIYSNSPNSAAAATLIGKTMPGERGWKDYGPTLMQGYVAPGYVPTTPPSSSQNQMFGSQIVSGGGTTALVLANNVPTSVTSQRLMHDDGQALTAAFTALHATSLAFGTVFMTTPQGTSPQFPSYIINYPTTVPAGDSLIMGCFTYINETLEFLGGNAFWASPLGYLGSSDPAFGTSPYIAVAGNASPLVWINGNAVTVQNIFFSPGGGLTNNPNDHNGQYGLIIQAEKVICRDCYFGAGISSTAIPCVLNSPVGGMDEIQFEDCQWSGSSVFGVLPTIVGQSAMLPAIPNLWIHGSDNTGGIGNSGQISISGTCSFQGRGILIDGLNYSNSTEGIYNFGVGGTIEYQAPCTYSVMCWGQFFEKIVLANWTNDTQQGGIIANWTNTFVYNVVIDNCITSGDANFATGLAIKNIEFKGCLESTVTSDFVLGQNINRVARTTGAILVTSGSTSDVMTIGGIYQGSIPQISAGNASAAADMAAGNVSWSALGANTITINHGSTSGMIFSVSATGGF